VVPVAAVIFAFFLALGEEVGMMLLRRIDGRRGREAEENVELMERMV